MVLALLAAPALGAKLPSAYKLAFSSGRIIGGSNANAGQFPYQAALDRNNQHWCGGSILNNNHVLTAAHCVEAPQNEYRVYLGQHNRNNRDGNVQSPNIQSITIHPDYTGSFNDGVRADVAVIRTNTFTLNSRVQAIALAASNANFEGQACDISGWGQTGGWGTGASTLQWTRMNAMSLSACRNAMPSAVVENYHLCFLSGNQQSGACSGDSGGPARCSGVLAGVTSWVTQNIITGACITSSPSVYASVSFYRNWIINNS